jgi:hypothetical protein
LANQQENLDVLIQLPWTVPQQPNVQTIVLQQPTKTHMELNASTDKTAISSFALSVVIALILGGLATWLAYWYGRKSFVLTELSFKVVSEDIRQAAKTNSDIAISMMENQITITELQIRSKEKSEELERIITRGGEIIVLQNKLIIELYKLATLGDEIFKKDIETIVSRLNELNNEILSEYHLFLLLMSTDSKEYSRIKILGDLFLQIAWEVAARVQLNHNIGSIYLDEKFKETLYNSFKENCIFDEDEVNHIKKIIEDEVYDLLSNVSDVFQNEIHLYLLSKKAA